MRDGAAATRKLAGVEALRPILHKFYKILNMQVATENGLSHMIRVSSAEFQRNIGRYQDLALTQPVAVTRNGRERTVMISVEEYHRLKRRDRQVLGLDDFTDADIAALEQSQAPDSSKSFDDELSPS
jgi:Antitoxin Phd_YefM, type II toxin-antitoxin system